jgi:hypothetical protein
MALTKRLFLNRGWRGWARITEVFIRAHPRYPRFPSSNARVGEGRRIGALINRRGF